MPRGKRKIKENVTVQQQAEETSLLEKVMKNCGTCGRTANRDGGLFCLEENEKVGKMDSCHDKWEPLVGERPTITAAATEMDPASIEQTCADCGHYNFANEYCPELKEAMNADAPVCAKFADPDSLKSDAAVDELTGQAATEGGAGAEGGEPEETKEEGSETVPSESTAGNDEINERRSLKDRSLSEEMPEHKPTTAFNLGNIPTFLHELGVGLTEIYNYQAKGGGGEPSLTIKLTGFGTSVKCALVVDLPHRIKLGTGSISIIKENGEFRMVAEGEQMDLYERRMNRLDHDGGEKDLDRLAREEMERNAAARRAQEEVAAEQTAEPAGEGETDTTEPGFPPAEPAEGEVWSTEGAPAGEVNEQGGELVADGETHEAQLGNTDGPAAELAGQTT